MTAKGAWIRPTVFYTLSVAFFARAFLGLLPALVLGWPELIAATFGGGVCALIANPHAIEAIKLPLGFEARTRAVVERAEATLNELQRMTEIIGGVLVDQIAASGRWGEGRSSKKVERKDRVLEAMRVVGLPESAVDRVSAADRVWVLFDYVGLVTGDMKPEPGERTTEWNAFWKQYDGGLRRPDPGTLEEFLSRFATLNETQCEWLADYRYYHEHSKHRRPDAWRERYAD